MRGIRSVKIRGKKIWMAVNLLYCCDVFQKEYGCLVRVLPVYAEKLKFKFDYLTCQ